MNLLIKCKINRCDKSFFLILSAFISIRFMRLVFLVLFVFVCFVSNAQIISMEERKSADGKNKLQGDIDLSLNFTHNNQDIIQTGNKLKLQYRDSLNTYLFSSSISFNSVDGVRSINMGSFGVMYNYKVPDKVISAEGIYQYEYNRIKKLKHRNILGGGPRFKIAEKESFKLSLVTYTIYLNELYERSDNKENKKSLVKFSSMLSLYVKLSENANFKHSTYYEPDYSDPTDYRIWSESNISMKISSRFSFNFNFRIDYDSLTPSGVDNTYYALKNSFAYRF